MREPWEERKTRVRKREGGREKQRERKGTRDGTTRNKTRGVFIAAVVKAVRPASVHRRFDTYRVFGNWWYKRKESRLRSNVWWRGWGEGNETIRTCFCTQTPFSGRELEKFKAPNLDAVEASRISRWRTLNGYEYQKFRCFSRILPRGAR